MSDEERDELRWLVIRKFRLLNDPDFQSYFGTTEERAPMKLTDMKMTKAEKKANAPGQIKAYDGPDYPYGLRLDLGTDALKKLGIDSLPKVGKYFTVTARACVTGVRSNESQNHEETSLELQIEKLALEPESKSMKDALDEGIDAADEDEQ